MEKSFINTIQSLQNMYHILDTYHDYYDGSKDDSTKLIAKLIQDIEKIVSKTEASYTKLITSPSTNRIKSRKIDEDLIRMQDVMNKFVPLMIYYSINQDPDQNQNQNQNQEVSIDNTATTSSSS